MNRSAIVAASLMLAITLPAAALSSAQIERGVALAVIVTRCGAEIDASRLLSLAAAAGRMEAAERFRAFFTERFDQAHASRGAENRAHVCRIAIQTVRDVGGRLGLAILSEKGASQ